ncbi:MarR family winged helix-turn-helix transcriptional regulator [Glycomyces tenuis]|uniref:MarR family winged helix-turn-helix transcriptional regulator n=1 Tax=Glycomyces tenuis TaxID=58116 RepID=UPI00040F8DBA|nr:MarR family transcriptional regulator [Glycomyces tenuis]
MNDRDPAAQADRITEVFDLVGPLYRRTYRKVEQDSSQEGLSVGVRAVLVMLYGDGPMTVPQMGRAQSLSRQFVQRMVNEAGAGGLVETVPNPAHKRSALVRLTDEGRSVIGAVRDRERAIFVQIARELDDADVDACIRVLSRMVALLDHVDMD